jgi:hypothetical protein
MESTILSFAKVSGIRIIDIDSADKAFIYASIAFLIFGLCFTCIRFVQNRRFNKINDEPY